MPHPKATNLARRPLARLGLLLVLSLLLWPASFDQELFAAQTKKNASSARKVPVRKPQATTKKTETKKNGSVTTQTATKSQAKNSKTVAKSITSRQFNSRDRANVSHSQATNNFAALNASEEELAEGSIGDSGDRDMINFSTVTKGLTGQLTTGKAGADFLATYGRLAKRPSLSDGERLAALDYDNAPRSNRFLRMSQGATNRLLVSAYSQTGRPFHSGGHNPMTGFDDVGFVTWLFAQEGLKLPAQPRSLVAAGQAVARDELRPGDILVYQLPKAANYVVGVYSGNGNFILASKQHRGITEAAAFDTEYGPYFVGGRRFLDDPKASPLSDDIKTEATNGAVKLALSELGDNIPKPANIYGSVKKSSKSKNYRKNKSSRRSGYKAKSSLRKPLVKKSTRSKKR
ncbi:MAG: C40 family peptidase [Deltaproteobacteria bacterium]|jgi:cell wall-associated NlpC family hydrolase|nr:C40 family peptidase [Deltaproteobacteria bacterium]